MQRHPKKNSLFLCILLAYFFIGVNTATALDIGDQAPDFSLPSTTGKPISLSQFKGKKHVLIQFYTMDFNPT